MSESELKLEELLDPAGPACLIVTAKLAPVGGVDRFQPAGFPEVGQVIYPAQTEDVCIIDSPSSMANHLETVCFNSATDTTLHSDLDGLPYVVCVTDGRDQNGHKERVVCTSLTEAHRLAAVYILKGQFESADFRNHLKTKFGIETLRRKKSPKKTAKKAKAEEEKPKYFVCPENWWDIYRTIFQYDPNSLLHGVFFASEKIQIRRMLAAHLEGLGAKRVVRSGVKFDRLGRDWQPIFRVDEMTAREIRATFVIDLALLRSYGRGELGLSVHQKRLLLGLAIWKITRLLERSFPYRTGCQLECIGREVVAGAHRSDSLPKVDLHQIIKGCAFKEPVTRVHYPAQDLFENDDVPNEATADEEEQSETNEILSDEESEEQVGDDASAD